MTIEGKKQQGTKDKAVKRKTSPAKTYFLNLGHLDKNIDSKLEHIHYLRSKAERITAGTFDGTPRSSSGNNDKVGTFASEIVDLQNEIRAQVETMVARKRVALERIEALENEQHRVILTQRYMLNKNLEAIADNLEYSYRQVTRIHREALKAFEAMYPDIC